MGRPAKFDRRGIATAAMRLAAEHGPGALTVAALAGALGAPVGSIYHRFESRELLLAEVWIDVVERFQSDLAAALATASDVDTAAAAARQMIAWTRAHELEARLLLLHRRQDFVTGEWPPALVERAAALEPQIGEALRAFAKRAFGRSDAELMARVRFALIDAPLGGIKPYLQARRRVPQVLEDLVGSTVRAALNGVARPRRA